MLPDDFNPTATAIVADSTDLPAFIGRLAEAQAEAQRRLFQPPEPAPPEHSISVEEGAKRLGVSLSYIYKHKEKLPFVRNEGRRVVVSVSGLDRYMRRRSR